MANNLLAKSDASEECSDISKEGAVSPGNNDEKQSGDAEFLDEVIMKPPVRLRRHSEGALSLPSDETQGTGFKGQINITEPFPQSILDILERLKTERDREEPADELLNEQKGDVIPGDVDENIKGQQDARAYENSKRPLLTRPRPRIGVDALFASKGKSIVNEVENETGSRLEPSTPVAPSVSRDHNLLSVDRNILRGDSRNSRRTSNLSSIRREQRPLGTISETGDYDVLFQRKGYESPPIPHVYHAPEYDINLQRTATTERRHDHPAADDDLDNGKNGADDSGTMVLEAAVWEYKTDPVKISVRKDDVDRTSFETMLSDPNCNLIGPFRRPNLHFDGPFRLIKPVDLPSGERIYVLDKSQPLYPAQNSWSSDPGTERYRARTPSLAPDDWSRMIEPNEAMDGRINSTIGLRDVYRCEEDDPENGGGVLVDRIFEIGAPVRRRVFRETVQPYLTDVDGRVSDRPWFEEGKILPAPERNQPVGRTSDLNDKKNAKRRASRLINEAPPSEQNEQEAGDEKSSVKAGSSTKLKKPGFTTDMLIAKRQSLGSVASFYEINDRHSLHHVPREYGLIDNNDSRETIDPQRDIFVPRDPGELGLPAGYGDLVPRKLSAEEIAAKRRLTETKDVDEKPRVKPNDRRVVSEFRDAADLNQQLRNGSLPQIGSDNLGHYSGNDDARRPESNVSWQSREPSIVAMAEDRQKLRIYSRRYVITNSNFHWNGYRVKSKNNRLIEKC
ncbi:uncharacterized protein LOC141909981 [Tubulanus polymorphus]|uniref:uncharacterized protein LOC141909981 n=1 Tax=Tubulanus polymorphus TaxID=672921 RepID=UPI003DA482CF